MRRQKRGILQPAPGSLPQGDSGGALEEYNSARRQVRKGDRKASKILWILWRRTKEEKGNRPHKIRQIFAAAAVAWERLKAFETAILAGRLRIWGFRSQMSPYCRANPRKQALHRSQENLKYLKIPTNIYLVFSSIILALSNSILTPCNTSCIPLVFTLHMSPTIQTFHVAPLLHNRLIVT